MPQIATELEPELREAAASDASVNKKRWTPRGARPRHGGGALRQLSEDWPEPVTSAPALIRRGTVSSVASRLVSGVALCSSRKEWPSPPWRVWCVCLIWMLTINKSTFNTALQLVHQIQQKNCSTHVVNNAPVPTHGSILQL
jgi:hypothetical protein